MKKLFLAGSVVLVLLTCATQTHAQASRTGQSTSSSASIPFVTEITPRSAPSGAVIQLQIQSDIPSGSLLKYRLAIGGVTARFYPVYKDDWSTIVAVVPYKGPFPADAKPGSLIPVDVNFFDPQEHGGNVYSQFSLLVPTGLKGKEVEISGVRPLTGSDFDVTFNDYIPVELWPQVTIYFDNKAVSKILKMDERAFTVERPFGVSENRFEVFARVGDNETSVFKYDRYATPLPTATATPPNTLSTLESGRWSNAELIFFIVSVAAVGIGIWFLLRRMIFSSRRSESFVPTGIEALSLPDVPSDLIDACAAGECVLYGGPGLSIESGFPTRSEFVKGLVDWAHNAKLISQDEAASYRVEVDRGQGDAVADSLASRLTTSDQQFALTSYLQSIFLKRARPSELHAQLKGISFSAILTTNLDTLLETTFGAKDDQVYTPTDSESLLSAMTRRTFFILKLHGKLSEPSAVVVAPRQYEISTSGNTLFSDFMKTLFLSRTLLFVGSSVEGIEDYLRSLTQGREIAPDRTHYALVAVTDRAWRAKAELLERRFGVKVLPYTGDHAQLSQFLNKLKDALPAKEVVSPASPETVSRLKRITLANIGPFENLTLELDLDFKPAWHIFLGDNGVGKSTVIKAIALALCGKEAQPYASRFLRDNGTKNTTSEELTGTITLETNNKKTYVTTIRRNKKGDVELISSTSKPLEAEGWLALGFPPLRTTSWEGPKGPDADIKRKSRPVVSDLCHWLRVTSIRDSINSSNGS